MRLIRNHELHPLVPSPLVPAVCRSCGAYDATARGCAACGDPDSIAVRPLFVLTGASGVGKTTIVVPLQAALPDVNVFDTDALLGLSSFGEGVHWDAWLNVVYAGAQVGRSTLLSGTLLPEWLEELPARDLIGPVYIAVLHCDDRARSERLRARPEWRQSSSPEFIERHNEFANALLDRGWPVFDTTSAAPVDVASSIALWVRASLAENN